MASQEGEVDISAGHPSCQLYTFSFAGSEKCRYVMYCSSLGSVRSTVCMFSSSSSSSATVLVLTPPKLTTVAERCLCIRRPFRKRKRMKARTQTQRMRTKKRPMAMMMLAAGMAISLRLSPEDSVRTCLEGKSRKDSLVE